MVALVDDEYWPSHHEKGNKRFDILIVRGVSIAILVSIWEDHFACCTPGSKNWVIARSVQMP